MATRLLALIGSALLVAALPAMASPPAATTGITAYALDPTRSALKFQFKQAGAVNQGRFRKFGAVLSFGDANLAASKLEVTIDVNSLDTGDEERDAVLRDSDLFNVAKFPQARFKATRITRISAGRYEAAGTLTIRDATRNVRVPFEFRTANEQGVLAGYMTGRVPINRLDFGVGQGEWQATDQVANQVNVTFTLRFTPTTAK
jgi:polyisoprenoid-binding protein YceI